jgi:2'-5' RNA ligase
MEAIRAFVAIELDRAFQVALRQIQDPLKRSRVSHIARWVPPSSVHLTLRFLGNVPVNRVEEIRQGIVHACEGYSPFSVSLAGLGVFPNDRRPRVIWVGVGGEVETLTELQRAVDSTLEPLGFKPEKRGFTPHLTLARIRDRARPPERMELASLVIDAQDVPAVSMTVTEVCLIRSDLKPTGAVYTRLAAIPLAPA